MRKVQILTDSCSDLTPELMEKYGIDYMKMNTVLEGKESPADLSWSAEEVHDFYEIMRAGRRITTTQVPVEEFNRVFDKYLTMDCDIVYIACCSKQSGSVFTGKMVAEKYKEKYPDNEIYCLDSLNACLGEGILAIEAAKYAAGGRSAAEVADYNTSVAKNVNEFVTVHSLDALKRAGRVSGSAAFFGNLMGVKPIIISDKNGVQAAYRKVKGRQTSFREIVNMMKEVITEPGEQTLYLAHADCSEAEINALKNMIESELPCRDIYVAPIGPIIGASIGPDAIGIFAMGKQVTFAIEE